MRLKELMDTCTVNLDINCYTVGMKIHQKYLSANLEIVYYWYHHMIQDSLRDVISFVINNGLYTDFIELYNTLNTDEICYLPSEAYIYADGDCIGILPLDDSTAFNMITYSECECG